MLLINPHGEPDHAYVFRHRKAEGSTTSNVQGGHQNWAHQTNRTGEGSIELEPKQPHKKEGKQSDRKEDWRKTSKKTSDGTRDDPSN